MLEWLTFFMQILILAAVAWGAVLAKRNVEEARNFIKQYRSEIEWLKARLDQTDSRLKTVEQNSEAPRNLRGRPF